MTCSMIFTLSPFFKRAMTSPANDALPRTFTLSPLIVASPGTSTIGFSAGLGGAAFFIFADDAFFFSAFGVGAFGALAGGVAGTAGAGGGVAGGFVVCCASKL